MKLANKFLPTDVLFNPKV